VLVAEVMLQQTQVWRIERALPQFLERFPTVAALAAAVPAEVITAWHGLGYNRRAAHLHACAQAIVDRHGGTIPKDYHALRQLPGIGDYTARAVLAFAFNMDVAVVDVNVRRVLSRLCYRQPTTADVLPMSEVSQIADALLPRGGGRWWNEALMDLGSGVCLRRVPRCSQCPWHKRCASAATMRPAAAERRRTEPLHRGIPRRLWRGRLVELLRQRNRCSIAECAALLFDSPTADDRAFVEELAAALARDGLLAFSPEDSSVALPRQSNRDAT
jgi:A/G-specific adenine glycosylase